MAAIYSEIEPFPAQWLRNLIGAGEIMPGQVLGDINEITADEVRHAEQAHFFAGLGGWPIALQLAGWPAGVTIWTGSCPCQPFSVAGRGKGTDDERHLWPVWFRLIQQCRPTAIFGEQVASPAGRAWLDAVSADLEGEGYAVGAAVLPACSVGAPHKRDRLWFVAYADGDGLERVRVHIRRRGQEQAAPNAGGPCSNGGLADAAGLEILQSQRRHLGAQPRQTAERDGRANVCGSVGDTHSERAGWDSRAGAREEAASSRQGVSPRGVGDLPGAPGAASEPWSSPEWLDCRDGKRRPAQPGVRPLAHGVPGRVGRVRAYGNAIVPQVAAAFVTSSMEALLGVPPVTTPDTSTSRCA